MLKSLTVKNYALIRELEIHFGKGLNVLTGETGAGKSIILGALSTILGDRVEASAIRQGAPKAVIEGVFTIPNTTVRELLLKHDLDSDGEYLLVRREIKSNSRSRAFVNDTPVPLSLLQEIGDRLVDLHGQHEHQSLLKVRRHLEFLDAFANHDSDLETVKKLYDELQKTLSEINRLQKSQKSAEEKRDFYSFQLQEIDKIDPSAEEEEALLSEEKISRNSEKLFNLTGELYQLLYDSDKAVFEHIGKAESLFVALHDIDPEFTQSVRDINSAKVIIEELAKLIQSYKSGITFNPERAEEIQKRISLLTGLKKKYNRSIFEILEYREQIRNELGNFENVDEQIEKLKSELSVRQKEFSEKCLLLSGKRKKAAHLLEAKIPELLEYLGMPGSRFKVTIEYQDDPSGSVSSEGHSYRADSNGMDFVELFISTNAGQDVRPLAKVASGGEISRIMLALKSVMATEGNIPVLIFDEIDIGISGRIARVVGRKLKELANYHQVICITHLPQIASMGDRHYLVEKLEKSGQTETSIRGLSADERTEAIARLLAGDRVSETHLNSARELLQDT